MASELCPTSDTAMYTQSPWIPVPPTPCECEPVNQTLWRRSQISPDITISKTAITQQYRLNDADIVDLSCEKQQSVMTRNGKSFMIYMYLYKEREVERKAWIKHGSPEKFLAYMKRLRVQWSRKQHKGPFPVPKSYVLNSDGSVAFGTPPPLAGSSTSGGYGVRRGRPGGRYRVYGGGIQKEV